MVGHMVGSLRKLSGKVIVKCRNLDYLKHAKLYQHVLPLTEASDRLQFLKTKGPAFWKELDMESDPVEYQATQAFILTHPSLTVMLPVYFHLWNLDVGRFPRHIYEMGFGHHLQQCSPSFELLYLKSLNADLEEDPYLVSVKLQTEDIYIPYNTAYMAVPYSDRIGPEFKTDDRSPEEVFHLRMFCAESCTKRERWCEAFAHAVCTFDTCGPTFPHLHNLFCQMALAAGKMTLDHEIWIDLLLHAKLSEKYAYNKWRRIVVFMNLAVHHGMFQLSRQVLSYGLEQIPASSSLYYRLTTLHLQSLMAQIENIAAYQYLRQSFHRDCTRDNCDKPLNVKYSFPRMMVLIRDMEKCVQSLPCEAHRYYFQGYIYLYKTFTKVLEPHCDRDKTLMQMAKSSFDLALQTWPRDSVDAMYIDCHNMQTSLDKCTLEDTMIEQSYSALTNMHYNVEAANTCFRTVLLYYYWGDEYLTFSANSYAETAYKVYCRMTQHRGYRIVLLGTCSRHLEYGMQRHSDQEPDFPPLRCVNAVNSSLNESAENYWKMEKGELQVKTNNVFLTRQHLLSSCLEYQHLYAFGEDTINKLIDD